MIDIDSTKDHESRRIGRWAYVGLAVLVAAVAAAAVIIVNTVAGGNEIRFEVETRSGTAVRISWDVGVEHRANYPGTPGETITTPWSSTVSVGELDQLTSLKAMSADTDEVTCRIVVNGEVVAEAAQQRAVGCLYDPAGVMP